MKFIYIATFFITLNVLGQAKYYVDQSATGLNNGTSWANAYTDLQSALASSFVTYPADSIFVAEGVYKPSAYPLASTGGSSPRDYTFQVRDGDVLVGGFPAGGGVRNPELHKTFLDGDIGVAGNNSDNCYHVVTTVTFTTSSFVLNGVTVRNGNANGTGDLSVRGWPTAIPYTVNRGFGGGYASRNSSSNIKYVNFVNNKATYGGAYFAYGNQNYIYYCSFTGNSATADGGAVLLNKTYIASSNFDSNTAGADGGAIGSYGSFGTGVYNSIFRNNSAVRGGAIANTTNYVALASIANTFVDNKATSAGGAIYSILGSEILTDCVFYQNKSGGQANVPGADIIKPASTNVKYCLTQENSNFSTGTGIINNVDPLFIDAANFNFGPLLGSPLINAGGGLIGDTVYNDYYGNPRIVDGTVDIGAIEYQETLNSGVQEHHQAGLFPNPASSNFQVVSTDRIVSVSLFDMEGKNLVRKEFTPGEANIVSLDHIAAGAYAVIVTFENGTQVSKKLIVSK